MAQLVTDGRVQVDGVVVTTRSTPQSDGALLEVELPAPAESNLAPEPDVALTVVFFDADVIVVDKPAGLVVHPGAGHSKGTMAAGLLARFPDLDDLVAQGICAPERPGIVHRLDRGTSGRGAVARTPAAYRSLGAQLAERSVTRRYLGSEAGKVYTLLAHATGRLN